MHEDNEASRSSKDEAHSKVFRVNISVLRIAHLILRLERLVVFFVLALSADMPHTC